MVKTFVTAIIALLVGMVVTRDFFSVRDTGQSNVPDDHRLLGQLVVIEDRFNAEIEALKKQLDEERAQRLELAQRINDASVSVAEVDPEFIGSMGNVMPAFGAFAPPSLEQQIANLMNAGFDRSEAERIIELEAEINKALFSAGPNTNPMQLIMESEQNMRKELGDEQYESYLEATGRPTGVTVGDVAENSAGAAAGLGAGDKIVSYDGERVFSALDLQRLESTDTLGQTVIVDVERDGTIRSIAIPRGQAGISTNEIGFSFIGPSF